MVPTTQPRLFFPDQARAQEHTRHLQIRDDHVGHIKVQLGQCRRAAVGLRNRMAFVMQPHGDGPQQVRIVVHHQNACHVSLANRGRPRELRAAGKIVPNIRRPQLRLNGVSTGC